MKPKTIETLDNLNDVDNILFEIAQLRLQLKKIDAESEEQINKIREKAKKKAEPLLALIDAKEASLILYGEDHKDEHFSEKKKTVELTFGFVGFRKSTKITVKKSTVEKLEGMAKEEALIVKKSPNKEVLATWDDALLTQVDASRVVKDDFWYEIKEESITETAQKRELAA